MSIYRRVFPYLWRGPIVARVPQASADSGRRPRADERALRKQSKGRYLSPTGSEGRKGRFCCVLSLTVG